MKYRVILIPALGLVFLVIAVLSLSKNILSPYVPLDTARARAGSYVQIIGTFDRSVRIVHDDGKFSFRLVDANGATMDVEHGGPVPQNFEHAEQVVLLGAFNSDRGIFEAEKVLVKCPSKYRSTR